MIAYYRFPSIERLDAYDRALTEMDFVWDEFLQHGSAPGCVALLVAPPGHVPPSSAFGFDVYQRLTLFFCVCDIEGSIPGDLRDHVVHIAPAPGLLPEQAINEDSALIEFHQAATDSNDLVLYGPNGEGWYRAIFAVPMRVAPRVTIEALDAGLEVEIADQDLDQRSSTAQLKFRFRHKRTRAVVKEYTAVGMLELDAEL
ncbi:MAG TPA: hypothetical protein VFK41_01885 [Nocardioidaceae bacterium]|nr:hypothetical protein [Nocardioidaceae bacterium]